MSTAQDELDEITNPIPTTNKDKDPKGG